MICMSKITINTLHLSSNLTKKIISFIYYSLGIEIDRSIDGNNISFNASSLTSVQKNEFFQWLSYNNIEYTSTPTPQEPKPSYVLPITNFTDVSLFQNHVLLMQIPLINDYSYPWFCCNFINIYNYDGNRYDYTDNESFYEQASHHSCITYQNISIFNTKEIFIEIINKNNYIFLWVDKYYLPGAIAYNNFHDVHPVLIYGFDSKSNLYHCAFFEVTTKMNTICCPMEYIHKALESATFHGSDLTDRSPIYIIKPKLISCEYNSFVKRFLNELYNYTTGIGNKDELFFKFGIPIKTNALRFGLNVTSDLIDCLDKNRPALVDYRLFHLIAENKKLIYNHLCYYNKVICHGKLNKEINDYKCIVDKYESIRLKFMKFSLSENNMQTFYPSPSKESSINTLIANLTEAVSKEKEYLYDMFPKLIQNTFDNNVFDCPALLLNLSAKTYFDSDLLCGELSFENISGIRYIKAFVFENHLSGILYANSDNIIEKTIDGRYTTFEIYSASEDIKSISYKLTNFTVNKLMKPLYFCVYRNNLQYHLLNISCSSVFSERDDLCFSPNEVLTFTPDSFWSPETNDKERFILFELNETIPVNRVSILQHYNAIRLEKISIFYSDDKVNWKLATTIDSAANEIIENKTYTKFFNKVYGRFFKLVINRTKKDSTNYDVPNICYFDLNFV